MNHYGNQASIEPNYIGRQGPAAEPEVAFQEITRRLGAGIEMLGKCAERLDMACGRAFGGGAEVSGKPTPKPIVSGAIGTVNEQLQVLHDLTGRLQSAIDRVERIV